MFATFGMPVRRVILLAIWHLFLRAICHHSLLTNYARHGEWPISIHNRTSHHPCHNLTQRPVCEGRIQIRVFGAPGPGRASTRATVPVATSAVPRSGRTVFQTPWVLSASTNSAAETRHKVQKRTTEGLHECKCAQINSAHLKFCTNRLEKQSYDS